MNIPAITKRQWNLKLKHGQAAIGDDRVWRILLPGSRGATLTPVTVVGRNRIFARAGFPASTKPNRRGVAWDLVESEGDHVEIKRVASAESGSPELFATDEEAAGFVLSVAQQADHPNRELRDECREALRQLVDFWTTDSRALLRLSAGRCPRCAAPFRPCHLKGKADCGGLHCEGCGDMRLPGDNET